MFNALLSGIAGEALFRHEGLRWLQDLLLLLCRAAITRAQGGVQEIPHAMMPFRFVQWTGLDGGIWRKKITKRSDQDRTHTSGLLPLLRGSKAELSRRAIVPDRNEDQKEWRQSS